MALIEQGGAAARDGERVRLSVDAVTERGSTQNVIAESVGPHGGVVMAGAHLDSVPGGPGINDNGSGVATLLGGGRDVRRRGRRAASGWRSGAARRRA